MSTERPHTSALSVFLFFVCLYLLTAGGHFYNQDGYMKYLTLDQIAKGQGPFHPRFFTPGLGGRMTTSFPPGTSFWMLPFYLAGKGLMALVLSWNPAAAVDPSLFFAPLFVTFPNAFFSAGLCALFFIGLCRLGLSCSGALGATLGLGLGTLVWPYSKFCYSEPQAAFFLWAAFLAFLRLKAAPDVRKLSLAALWLACAFLTKYETVFLGPVFTAYGFYCFKKGRPAGRLRDFAAAMAPPLIFGAVLWMAWNQVRTGRAWDLGHYGGYLFSNPWGWGTAVFILAGSAFCTLRWPAKPEARAAIPFLAAAGMALYLLAVPAARKELHAILFTPGKSLFIFSPMLALAAAGYPVFIQRFRAEALLAGGLFFSYALFLPPTLESAAWQWGPRFFVSILPFLFFPALVFFSGGPERPVRRILKTSLMALAVGVQLLAVSVSYPDTFNYTSQRIAADAAHPMPTFSDERSAVFPRMIYDWRYSPLRMQAEVLQAVGLHRYPEVPQEALAFKTNVKKPSDLKWDFWWVYLWDWPGAAPTVGMVWLALVFCGLAALRRIWR